MAAAHTAAGGVGCARHALERRPAWAALASCTATSSAASACAAMRRRPSSVSASCVPCPLCSCAATCRGGRTSRLPAVAATIAACAMQGGGTESKRSRAQRACCAPAAGQRSGGRRGGCGWPRHPQHPPASHLHRWPPQVHRAGRKGARHAGAQEGVQVEHIPQGQPAQQLKWQPPLPCVLLLVRGRGRAHSPARSGARAAAQRHVPCHTPVVGTCVLLSWARAPQAPLAGWAASICRTCAQLHPPGSCAAAPPAALAGGRGTAAGTATLGCAPPPRPAPAPAPAGARAARQQGMGWVAQLGASSQAVQLPCWAARRRTRLHRLAMQAGCWAPHPSESVPGLL